MQSTDSEHGAYPTLFIINVGVARQMGLSGSSLSSERLKQENLQHIFSKCLKSHYESD